MIIFLCALSVLFAADNIESSLATIPGLEIVKQDNKDGFSQRYELLLEQPLDHDRPDGPKFKQRIFLSHRNPTAPVILETEGYDVRGFPTHELSQLLNANQIIVEYRYYGGSIPEPRAWQWLTNGQASRDHQRVIDLFKQFYAGKWISTGFSKGGESALIHRRFNPNGVDLTIAYDAPIILARQDKRTDRFLAEVGTPETRAAIKNFQRRCLKKRAAIEPFFLEYAKKHETGFKHIGVAAAVEYAVLEYAFAFWQHGHKLAEIPTGDLDAATLYNHLEAVSGVWLYCDKGIDYLAPSFYQHMRELGYYGFPHDHLKDLLVAVKQPDNAVFAPKDVDITYNPNFMKDVLQWLQTKGDRIIYLYGENDTWSACAVDVPGSVDALKIYKKGGAHGTHIRDLTAAQQQRIADKIRQWLGLEMVL